VALIGIHIGIVKELPLFGDIQENKTKYIRAGFEKILLFFLKLDIFLLL
jgi:hypothetical protein